MENIKQKLISLYSINKTNKIEYKQTQRENPYGVCIRTYHIVESKIETTLLHIIYNRIRNKKYQHTKDDNVYVESHKTIYKRILLREGILENYQESERTNHAS